MFLVGNFIIPQLHTNVWSENLKGRNLLEDPGLDGKIILKWILTK
jgi:hypothetical protein